MMKIKALCSFSGTVSMHKGEVRAVGESLAADLLQAGYAEAVEVPLKKEPAKDGKSAKKEG